MKLGRNEQYLKDDPDLDAYMLKVALQEASIEPGGGKPPIAGSLLEELARQYVLANSVIERLANWMDGAALRALADGLQLDLDTPAAAETSAAALAAVLHDAAVTSDVDARTAQLLRISRRQHGNEVERHYPDFARDRLRSAARPCDLQRVVDTRCGGRARRG